MLWIWHATPRSSSPSEALLAEAEALVESTEKLDRAMKNYLASFLVATVLHASVWAKWT